MKLQDIFNVQRCYETKNEFSIAESEIDKMTRNEIKSFLREAENNCISSDYDVEGCQFFFDDYSIEIIHDAEYLNDLDEIAETMCEINVKLIQYSNPVALLNTTIATADGEYKLKTITLEEAREILQKNKYISAIGHESTANIMSSLLDTQIELNRIQFVQKKGQKAICFKLKGRPAEGKLLSKEEIEKIGYEFKLLEMI